MTIAYETGTATGWQAVLSAMKTFLTSHADLVAAGQQWTAVNDTTEDGDRVLYMQAPGNGLNNVHLGFRETTNTTTYFNIMLCGFTGYNAGVTWYNQPGKQPDSASILLYESDPHNYWFIADGQRFYGMVKSGATYQPFYVGFLMPYGDPAAYPYPLFIGGASGDPATDPATYTTNRHAFWLSCGTDGTAPYTSYNCSGWVWTPGSDQPVQMLTRDPGGVSGADSGGDATMWPYGAGATTASQYSYGTGWLRWMRQNPDGTYNLFPTFIYDTRAGQRMALGELVGGFALGGDNVTPESIYSPAGNADQYLITQSQNNTGNDYVFAFKLP